jgi:hypothetical protein
MSPLSLGGIQSMLTIESWPTEEWCTVIEIAQCRNPGQIVQG